MLRAPDVLCNEQVISDKTTSVEGWARPRIRVRPEARMATYPPDKYREIQATVVRRNSFGSCYNECPDGDRPCAMQTPLDTTSSLRFILDKSLDVGMLFAPFYQSIMPVDKR
jgi:hypothetical protein